MFKKQHLSITGEYVLKNLHTKITFVVRIGYTYFFRVSYVCLRGSTAVSIPYKTF